MLSILHKAKMSRKEALTNRPDLNINIPAEHRQSSRQSVKSTLVYWHGSKCGYWPLEDGAECPSDHSGDIPIYAYRAWKGRKRRVWICPDSSDEVCYLTRKRFLEHDEEYCHA